MVLKKYLLNERLLEVPWNCAFAKMQILLHKMLTNKFYETKRLVICEHLWDFLGLILR